MHRPIIIALAAASLAAGTLAGQEAAPPADTLPVYILEGLTVTTTRQPTRRAETPQQIEVISATEIRRNPADELTDLLKEQIAVEVIQFPGLLAGVAIRGFRPQFSGINPRTLILVNGRPAGTSNLATLDLVAVERIEVLKGPASALYGSSAMGGVVNIITRQSSGAISSILSAGYGSFDTYEATLRSGGTLAANLDYDLSLAIFERVDDFRLGSSHLLSDGTIVKVFADGTQAVVEEFPGDTIRPFTQYGTRSGSVRLGYRLSDIWQAEVRGGAFIADQVQSPGDVNASYDGRSLKDLERYTGEVSLRGELDRQLLSLRAYMTDETAIYYSAPLPPHFVTFRTPTTSYGLQLQDALQVGAHTLTGGIDYKNVVARSERFSDSVTRGAPYSPNSSISSTAAFAQARLSLLDDRITATFGGRLDHITFAVSDAELFDGSVVRSNRENYTVFNPSFGLQYLGRDGLRVHTSGGRAFVTPDAFNVAGYSELPAGPRSVVVTRGNPALEPENSFSWDLGAGLFRPADGVEVDLTYFDTAVRDRITTRRSLPEEVRLTGTGDTIQSVTTYANADRAEIRGLEASAAYDFGALRDFSYSLRLFTNATRILQAEEISSGERGRIRNVADLTIVGGVEFDDLHRFSARISGRYVGERLDTDFSDFSNPGDVLYPEFVVLDAATRLRFADGFTLSAGIENLLDENYYEVRGYNLPGRSLRLGLAVEF